MLVGMVAKSRCQSSELTTAPFPIMHKACSASVTSTGSWTIEDGAPGAAPQLHRNKATQVRNHVSIVPLLDANSKRRLGNAKPLPRGPGGAPTSRAYARSMRPDTLG